MTTDHFNKKIHAFENGQRFMVPFPGVETPLGINLTQVSEPRMRADEHLIEMDFDGLVSSISDWFHGLRYHPEDIPSSFNKRPLSKPSRIPDAQSQQFWIHESTINSFMRQHALYLPKRAFTYTLDAFPHYKEEFASVLHPDAVQIKIAPNMSDILQNGKDMLVIRDGRFNFADDL